jgi:carboxymethylenebutenolidase
MGLASGSSADRRRAMSIRQITLASGTPAAMVVRPGCDAILVITPDIFGLRPLFEEMAERFAEQWDVSTIVVEPFPGLKLSDAVEQRMAEVPTLNDDRHLADLHLGIDAVIVGLDDEAPGASATVRRVGLMGFCMGGMYCFKAARSNRFDRIVSFYGMIRLPSAWAGPAQGEPLEHLLAGHPDRVLAIIGDQDTYTPPGDVTALAATGVSVVRYPEAEHGFAHAPERPAHRPADAANAFARARDWLVG